MNNTLSLYLMKFPKKPSGREEFVKGSNSKQKPNFSEHLKSRKSSATNKEPQNFKSKEPELTLKEMYRKLAAYYHPDKETGNVEIMQEINNNYSQGYSETCRRELKELYEKTFEKSL